MKKTILIAAAFIAFVGCQPPQQSPGTTEAKLKALTLELLTGEWLSHDPKDGAGTNDAFLELHPSDMSNNFNHPADFSMKMPDFWFAGKAMVGSNGDTLYLIRDQYVDAAADDYTSSLRNIGDTSYFIIHELGKNRLKGSLFFKENGWPRNQDIAFK